MDIKYFTEHFEHSIKVLTFATFEQGHDQFNHTEQADYDLLYLHVSSSVPHAGRAYYAVKLWRQVTWQIIYLQVASVHHLNCSVNISNLRQGYLNGNLHQISIPEEVVQQTPQHALKKGAEQLSEFFKQCHLHISRICRFSSVLSERLSADLIAQAILQVTPLLHETELTYALTQWQKALFSKQYSHYQFTQDTPKLRRAACCLNYNVDKAAYCNSCPKLKRNRN